jgi:predicted nuclease with TOPRIM domain
MNAFRNFIKSLQRAENKSILEATNDEKIALEIAMDHLAEHPNNYYTELKKMEEKLEKEKTLTENMTKESIYNLIKQTLNKKALSEFEELMYNTENNFFLSLELLFEDGRWEGLPYAAIKSIRKLQIKLGLYRPISEEELAQTVVSSGKKYDFSLGGVKYTLAKRFNEFEKEVSLTESVNYPPGFDIKELKNIRSFAGRIKYINQHLKKIGVGSARIVYQIDNDTVLKLAKNKKGIAQNDVEGDWGLHQMYPDILPELIDKDEDDDLWIIKKFAKKSRRKNLNV